MRLDSEPTKAVPRRVRLAIERNIAAMKPELTIRPRTKRESMCMESVETARPLQRVALFDGMCALTGEERTGGYSPSVSQCEPWNNHRRSPTNSL